MKKAPGILSLTILAITAFAAVGAVALNATDRTSTTPDPITSTSSVFIDLAAVDEATYYVPSPGNFSSEQSGGLREAGACCLLEGCVPMDDETECSAQGGFFFAGVDCADDPCGIGACCYSSGCTDADAYSCLIGGREFMGAGTTCQDDPCDVGWGACCLGDDCIEIPTGECSDLGGIWVGPGKSCDDYPCDEGACCLNGDECFDCLRYECTAVGGWYINHAQCADDPCGLPDNCPDDSLFSQSRDYPNLFNAMTSEVAAGFKRYENFTNVKGPIDELLWWGLDLHFTGSGWMECEETGNVFYIDFHKDAGGIPGELICSYKLDVTRTPTGLDYEGTELNEYSVILPEPCVLTNGWISIQGIGDPECWFLWMSAGMGYSYCEGCKPTWQDWDLSICLVGTEGGVFGSCCNDVTGQCDDGIEITDCADPSMRFNPDLTCEELDPPCGVIIGACCFPDDTCSIELEEDCDSLGGTWLGKDSICISCPCIAPCPPEGVDEGEPICYDGYVDEFNGGCNADLQLFSPVAPGQTVCGTSGIFFGPVEQEPDFDWYEVKVTADSLLSWNSHAEFPAAAWIVDGSEGCPGYVLAEALTYECFDNPLAADVGPGTYWLVIAPWAWTDSSNCGTRYYGTVTVEPHCPGDIDGSDEVDVVDLIALLSAWGPCAPPCPEDIDFSGEVDVVDLLQLLSAWGPC